MSTNEIAPSYTDGDVDTNPSANPHLSDLIAERYSRRSLLTGGLTTASVFLGGSVLAACGGGDSNRTAGGAGPTVTTSVSTTARAGNVVALTGTATDSDGTISSTLWTQVSGPTVTIETPSALTTRFVAPAVTANTAVVLRLTATDNSGFTGQSEVTITIQPAALSFNAVAKSLNDVVTVPEGYTATVLYRLGDPITAATPAFANNGTDTGYANRAGDHHDGMSYFGLAATGTGVDVANSTRGLLVLNHENINQSYLHVNGATTVGGARPEAEALKEMECHGVSVVEIVRGTTWSYVQASSFNRRITPLTPMQFNGPVSGNAALRTRYSTNGTQGRGTLNNCANGYMPWSTYLTNEENWAGYFRRVTGDDAVRGATSKQVTSLNRYGIRQGAAGNYGWSTVTPADSSSTLYARWNASVIAGTPADGSGDFRNEPNQFGWVVEIDPYNPTSVPRKRTALGRMNHEGCWPSNVVAGRRPAFYMGDDAVGEYVYKFVSNTAWSAADANATDRLAIGDKYLDAGTLYVARFNANGTGQWLPLVFGTAPLTAANTTYPFENQADVLINTRLAADALGATKMDRPEWTAINPVNGEMYLTLTQNTTRTPATTDAANPRAYVDPKVNGTRTVGNANGHILRLRETGDTSEATTFGWDIYLFGSGRDLNATNINLSGLDDSNDFSMCDGLWFSRGSNAGGQATPLLWIETDDNAYTDVTNCMLLAAIPGTVNDGATRTITNSIDAATGTQATRVGAAPGTRLKRFLVGPKECEITGIDSTPDGRSLFVNIQHPGENGNPSNITSHWPDSQTNASSPARPRSATIVITKNDGGVVGL